MAHIENEFERHIPCSNCGSSDGNSLYSDGHTYCFVCHTRTSPDDDQHTNKMSSKTTKLQGYAVTLSKRGLSVFTCEKYKIYKDDELLRFHYFSSDGVLQGAKVKTRDKTFRYEGISTDTLFGQHLFPTSGKRIVITEGE